MSRTNSRQHKARARLSVSREVVPILLKVPSSNRRFEDAVDLISQSLQGCGLEFVTKYVTLSSADLFEIYPELPEPILFAQCAMFGGEEIGALIATGHEAISKVNRLKGKENDPLLCAPESWRYRLSKLLGYRQMDLISKSGFLTHKIYCNYVHVPKPEEVDQNLRFLRRAGLV